VRVIDNMHSARDGRAHMSCLQGECSYKRARLLCRFNVGSNACSQ
jgi:hypothetical protein